MRHRQYSLISALEIIESKKKGKDVSLNNSSIDFSNSFFSRHETKSCTQAGLDGIWKKNARGRHLDWFGLRNQVPKLDSANCYASPRNHIFQIYISWLESERKSSCLNHLLWFVIFKINLVQLLYFKNIQCAKFKKIPLREVNKKWVNDLTF